uniref:AF4/FMR2 family, member 3 n=1 Tax=Oryzias sinensis TaxID=183150 RepID=A0A8C7YV98_9TELE
LCFLYLILFKAPRSPAAQWQLDKWLQKPQKKSASTEQDSSQSFPRRLISPPTQRSLSPARSWDSSQEYSPSQSPIPSPQFSYSHNSPLPSPGYSYCPSPSPFTSTCPSPTLSPRHSTNSSPGVCPSPCGSPRASRSPSPTQRHPPRSPSPTLHAPFNTGRHSDPQTQNNLNPTVTSIPQRPKIRPWIPPLTSPAAKSKNHVPEPSSSQLRSKTRPKQDQEQISSRSKTPVASSRHYTQRSKSHPAYPDAEWLFDAPKAKNTTHFEQIQGNKSNPKTRPSFQQSLQQPTQTKPPPPNSSQFQSNSKATHISSTESNCRPGLGLKPTRSKSWEASASNSVSFSHEKLSKRKLNAKAGKVEHPIQDRVGLKRKEEKYQEKHQEKHQERKEKRRLAEEQLLRRRWIQSSEEEEEEEVEEVREHKREETVRGDNKRKKEQPLERKTAQAIKRAPANAERPHRPDIPTHREGTKRSKEDKQIPDPQIPVTSPSPSPHRVSSSSSSSSFSSSDSESEPQVPVAKVPADSTSHKRPTRKGQQGPGRPDAIRTKSLHCKEPSTATTDELQQSKEKRKLYTLVPFGRSEKAPPNSQRGLRNLVVQIDLCLLKRIPDSTTDSAAKKPASFSSYANKQGDVRKQSRESETSMKDGKRKRKLENGVSQRENKRSVPDSNDRSRQTASPSIAAGNVITETVKNGCLEELSEEDRPTPPLSPLSPLPQSPESNKPTSKAKPADQHHFHTQKSRDKSKDPAVKPKSEVECVKVSKQLQPVTETSWSLAGAKVPNHETPHHAEYYLHEAKRMKHRADAMVDKLGKAVNYIDAALSFMECGKAMEEGPLEAKSPYTMYSETVELIRYAMKLKSHSGPGARQEDKQLAVLCFRCLALLYWQMFRLKKDHALKYSKVLLNYFKASPKVPATAPSWGDSKNTGKPPSSLTPTAKQQKQEIPGTISCPFLISIPHRIHQMAANHLNITNSFLYSYEYWEVADNLAKENKEFFNYLNTLSGPLTLHSSIAHAVQYTRQALQWIRISAKLN